MPRTNYEIEITLRCTRACPECNRFCHLDWFDQSDTDMTMEQIERFVDQVKSAGRGIGQITLIGGEPMLHPKLGEIIDLLQKELVNPRIAKRVKLATNGDLLHTLPISVCHGLHIKVDAFDNKAHRCLMAAPCDTGQKCVKLGECPTPLHCGLGVNCYGYWPCGAGSAIARLFGLSQYRHTELPLSIADFGDLQALCELCQAGARRGSRMLYGQDDCTPTKSWAEAIEKYKANPIQWDKW